MVVRSLMVIAALMVTGCADQEGVPRTGSVKCRESVMASHSVPPSLPSEFARIRYVVSTSSHGESGTCVRRVQRAPEHAAKFGPGVLLGGDRGEWGGELVLRDGIGNDKKLLEENVISIHTIGTEAYVFTGLSHMGKSFGSIYRLEVDPKMIVSPPLLITKFDAPPSAVSYEEKSGFRLQFGYPDASGRDGGKEVEFRCFSVVEKGMLTEFACSHGST